MFYRVGKIKCEAGRADEVLNYFRSNEDFFVTLRVFIV